MSGKTAAFNAGQAWADRRLGEAPELFDRGIDSANPVTHRRQADLPANEKLFADAGKIEAPRIASHRATTSSRTPGKVNTGTVWFQSVIGTCPDCDGKCADTIPPGRHAPHWRDGVLVNCREKPLEGA